MDTEDFLKLPADFAAQVFAQYELAGQSSKALELYQAYIKMHRIDLRDLSIRAAKEDQAVQALVSLAQVTTRSIGTSIGRILKTWKSCPHCCSKIKSAATVCRYCQRDVADT